MARENWVPVTEQNVRNKTFINLDNVLLLEVEDDGTTRVQFVDDKRIWVVEPPDVILAGGQEKVDTRKSLAAAYGKSAEWRPS